PFRVALIDWQMPGLDGLETARRVPALGLRQPPQLALVTAFGHDDVYAQAREVGMRHVLVKPVTASVLFDTLVDVVSALPSGQAPAPQPQPHGDPSARLAQLRGAHVLLVEDNDINQQVAREMLQQA
ncbi:response regulator, partial [Aquabacterium sp. A08]|uniref:response regulator n=1 Tax=Aquabacterium sp. A08 TaxID=2718532 RepID=UPI0014224A2A